MWLIKKAPVKITLPPAMVYAQEETQEMEKE